MAKVIFAFEMVLEDLDLLQLYILGVEIKFFLFGRSFLVLTQSHWSSPIVTKRFGGAVGPLFHLAFAGSFPCFSYIEVLYL